jgi:hypothetical protein
MKRRRAVQINDYQHQYGRPGVITGDPRIYGRVYLGSRGILYADPTLSGTYKITNRKSGLSLTVPGSSKTRGTQLVQSAFNGGLDQQWEISANSNGTYMIKNKMSNQSVNVSGESSTDGFQIIQWKNGAAHNQGWLLEPIGDGNFKMISKITDKAITVENASDADGANIVQGTYTSDGTTNDEWKVEFQRG